MQSYCYLAEMTCDLCLLKGISKIGLCMQIELGGAAGYMVNGNDAYCDNSQIDYGIRHSEMQGYYPSDNGILNVASQRHCRA